MLGLTQQHSLRETERRKNALVVDVSIALDRVLWQVTTTQQCQLGSARFYQVRRKPGFESLWGHCVKPVSLGGLFLCQKQLCEGCPHHRTDGGLEWCVCPEVDPGPEHQRRQEDQEGSRNTEKQGPAMAA